MKREHVYIPIVLALWLQLAACESDAITPMTDSAPHRDIRIVVLTPVRYPGDTVIIATVGADSGAKDLLYYWTLGDDSTFSANLDTVRHVYGNPGFYSITLTVRKAANFSLVSRDTALVEVLDTSYRSPDFLYGSTKLEARVRAVFTSIHIPTSFKTDTFVTILDTTIIFPFSLGSEKALTWEIDSFYAESGDSQFDQGTTHISSSGTSTKTEGSCPLLNHHRALKLFYKVGESSSYDGRGASKKYQYHKQLHIHLLPLLSRNIDSVVFSATGKRGIAFIREFEEATWSSGSNGTSTNITSRRIKLADVHLQNDSAFIEVRFIK